MPNVFNPQEILNFARNNNWLCLYSSEGNILNSYLTPAGMIVEIYIEKNKATVKSLLSYVAK